jgi:hypothetical protein
VVWVPGTFTVTAASTPAFAAKFSSGWWTGELKAQGVDPAALTHHGIAPVSQWPHAGQVVPVTVVPTDLTLIKFDWAAADSRERAGMDAAQRLVERDKASGEAAS